MNIAIIIAGGSGHRMGQDIPKQFIKLMRLKWFALTVGMISCGHMQNSSILPS